jgi:DNA-binding IclR family transcriptional regulator
MNKRSDSSSRYNIRAVERALLLLKAFLGNKSELTAGEISKEIDLDPSTTFRMLVTLEAHGFVKQDAGTGKYRLGVQCLELGSQFLKSNDVRGSALGMMQKLRDQFGETVHLGILDGNEIVYLEKVTGSHAIGLMSSHVGGRAPAHATAIGKVLLANLPPAEFGALFARRKLARCTASTITDYKELEKELACILEDGYAIDNQEHEAGVKCVATPIYGHRGVVAALSISGPVDRLDEQIKKNGIIPALKKAGQDISIELGWGRGVDQIGKPNGEDRATHPGKRPRIVRSKNSSRQKPPRLNRVRVS